MRGGVGASTDVPIAPRDASDGRVFGLVFLFLTLLSNAEEFIIFADPSRRNFAASH